MIICAIHQNDQIKSRQNRLYLKHNSSPHWAQSRRAIEHGWIAPVDNGPTLPVNQSCGPFAIKKDVFLSRRITVSSTSHSTPHAGEHKIDRIVLNQWKEWRRQRSSTGHATDDYDQWRREGGGRGGICPRALAEGGAVRA